MINRAWGILYQLHLPHDEDDEAKPMMLTGVIMVNYIELALLPSSMTVNTGKLPNFLRTR